VNLRAYWRFIRVARQFLPLLLAYARDRRRFLLFGGSRSVDAATRRRRAESLLESMLTLGPTFVKLGQILSTRPDVLPPEYIDVFTRLQDSVPPAPWEEARTVLEEEVGPVDRAFDEFDADAISGASLGQVYYAVYDGDPVAVKIRRPGVESLVEADLRVIKFSVPLLARFVSEAQAFSLETLADEFATVIRQEMDYRRERRMLLEIRENFADEPAVRIPSVVDEASTGRVLTMEYVPGTKISDIGELDAAGIDRTALAEILQRVYLQMIVEDGVFHADPHPGNLAVQDDGTLVFYDFGMSGRVDPFIQDRIVDFYTAVARQDVDEILDTLIEMGTLSPSADRETMADVMELAIADARGEEIEQYRVQQIVEQVEDTIYEFPLRLPPNLALVLRVATVVEGVCVTLDPDFDFIEVATDYLDEQGYIEEGIREFIADSVDEVTGAAQSAIRVPSKLERTLDRVERGDVAVEAELRDPADLFERLARRIVLGLFLAANTIAAAYLYAQAPLPIALLALGGVLASLLMLYRSFRDSRGIRAEPQFTRQNLRQREQEAVEERADSEPETDAGAAVEFGMADQFGPDAEPERPGGGDRPDGHAHAHAHERDRDRLSPDEPDPSPRERRAPDTDTGESPGTADRGRPATGDRDGRREPRQRSGPGRDRDGDGDSRAGVRIDVHEADATDAFGARSRDGNGADRAPSDGREGDGDGAAATDADGSDRDAETDPVSPPGRSPEREGDGEEREREDGD